VAREDVLLLMCPDQGAHHDAVPLVGPDERGERVSRPQVAGQRRVAHPAQERRVRQDVELRIEAVGPRLIGEGEVAGQARGLRIRVGIADAHRDRLVAVVEDAHAGVIRRDGLRAGREEGREVGRVIDVVLVDRADVRLQVEVVRPHVPPAGRVDGARRI
jgi:hypothetical protein